MTLWLLQRISDFSDYILQSPLYSPAEKEQIFDACRKCITDEKGWIYKCGRTGSSSRKTVCSLLKDKYDFAVWMARERLRRLPHNERKYSEANKKGWITRRQNLTKTYCHPA